jgi:hypothetical protein
MTPFKRLVESEGRDAWLESAAQQVREGDPWALVSEQQAQRAGASALAQVRERSSRKGSRALALAFAVIASSAALAAVGKVALAPHAAVSPAPARVPVRVEPSVGAPPVTVPQREREIDAPVGPPARQSVERKRPAPALAPKVQSPVQSDECSLDGEAKILLKALNQLRVESDPDGALATLDAHDVKCPKGALKQEAAAARAEAQAKKAGRSE